jgi:uncharacterized membrane protein YgcG
VPYPHGREGVEVRSSRGTLHWVARLLLPAALLGLLAGCGLGSGKSYSLPEVRIEATVLPDGSIRLVEQRTFDFQGQFSFAFFTVAEPLEHVQDFEVTEDGRALDVVQESDLGQFRATWYFSAQDDQRTFRISYRVICAVQAYRDAAHLLWQFVGTGWDVPTDHVSVRVHLPEATTKPLQRPPACTQAGDTGPYPGRPLHPGETRAWGHGPLGGEVRIPDPHTVELEVTDVPPYTFVEGSILFPPRAVPTAALIPVDMRASILATEWALAEQANAARRQFLQDQEEREAWRNRAWVLVGAVPLIYLLLVVIARLRDRFPGVPRLLTEPPEDIRPMKLVQLWGAYRGAIDTRDAYRTQLLHLAENRAIEMRAEGLVSDPQDILVRLREMPGDGSLDREFVEFLFLGDREWVSLRSITGKGKRKSELREWWNKAKDAGRAGFGSVRQSRWESILTSLIGFLGILFAIPLIALAGWVGGIILAEVVAGMILAHIAIPVRPGPPFRERIARWKAFRRFLKRFSSLPDAPALAVIIWERYLVYATALGVADRVEKQVKALIPPQELPSPWPGAPGGVASIAWVSTFHDSTPSQVAAWVMPRATSSSSFSSGLGSFSSGGGFGGGFSGGGGGGGGGTGGGAG